MKADKFVWIGRVLSGLGLLPFIPSLIMKLSRNPQVLEGWAKSGWPESMLLVVAILEAICIVLYLIPQLSVLGAVMLTGYLGGTIAHHLRAEESVVVNVILGLLIWGGLYLREPRLRAILPFRTRISSGS